MCNDSEILRSDLENETRGIIERSSEPAEGGRSSTIIMLRVSFEMITPTLDKKHFY